MSEQEKTEDVTCPFCNEDGFDLPGLKFHLQAWCEAYDATDTSGIHPMFA